MSGPFPESLWPKLYIELPDSATPANFGRQ